MKHPPELRFWAGPRDGEVGDLPDTMVDDVTGQPLQYADAGYRLSSVLRHASDYSIHCAVYVWRADW